MQLQLRLAGRRLKVTEGKGRGVVEYLAGGLPQERVAVGNPGLVEAFFRPEDRPLGRFQHRIQPAEHRHREDHIAVFAADVEIAEHIVGNAPDKVCKPVEVAIIDIAEK